MKKQYRKITKQESYYLGITMWGYLYNFPEIDYKYKLPKKLYNIIKELYFKCPCCAVFYHKEKQKYREGHSQPSCPGCPLDKNCIEGQHLYKAGAQTQ